MNEPYAKSRRAALWVLGSGFCLNIFLLQLMGPLCASGYCRYIFPIFIGFALLTDAAGLTFLTLNILAFRPNRFRI